LVQAIAPVYNDDPDKVPHTDGVVYRKLDLRSAIKAKAYRELEKRFLDISKTCESRYGQFGADVAVAAEGIFEALSEDLKSMADRAETES
jgi:hypothetical protein